MNRVFRLRGLIALVAAPLAVASMVATTATAASAAPSGQTKAAPASPTSDYKNVCGPLHKGGFTCFSKIRTNVHEPKVLAPNAVPEGYGPSDIQSAYNLPSATGSPTIAIVDAYDDPTAESDLGVYRAQYGLPPCTTANGCFQKVAQDGSTNYPTTTPPGDQNDWAVEETLDMDAVSAACPACHILLVEANSDGNNTDMYTAIQEAQKLGAKFISMSWGQPEDGSENSLDAQYLDDPGVVMTASSGDGSYSQGTTWPSDSQYTVSVGGTTLTRDSSTARGWTESAWSGAGSGCSGDVTQPSWQAGVTPCSNRAVADISADADPNTGLAIYMGSNGWGVAGGTSLAAPLIAAMYAIAGTPTAGTWPASYLYQDKNAATDLNDVTTGSNSSTGTCATPVLCTAGPGWDGPTGLGTPNGIGALNPAHGDVTGTVTNASTGKPVAGATVSLGGNYTTTTNPSGNYDMAVPAGSYNMTVTDWGYANGTASIAVATGGLVTQNISLTPGPTNTISGTVTDGSGHKWPIRAKITISGDPNGPIYSDPYTGQYSVTVPSNASYTLSVSAADLPGYNSQTATVAVGSSDVTQNLALTVASACEAPGYSFQNVGTTESFTGWTGSTPQDGWTVSDNNGSGDSWGFNNPGSPSYVDPGPANDANFASVDDYSVTTASDTSLTSPVIDLSSDTNPATPPELVFDEDYIPEAGQAPYVDVSMDGGATWEPIWSPQNDASPSQQSGQVVIPLYMAMGSSDVKVQFHWVYNPPNPQANGRWWAVGNVFVGEHTCAPLPGGLVEGVVSDANTGKPVNGVTVTSNSDSSQSGVSGPAMSDQSVPDGYYWLYSSNTGSTGFTLTGGEYASTTAQASVTADAVTQANMKIDAGRLTVSTPNVSVSNVLGAKHTTSVSFGNSGTAPVQVSLSGDDAGFTAMGATAPATQGAAPLVIKTSPAPYVTKTGTSGGASASGAAAPTVPAAGPWTDIADYETKVFDDGVAELDGKVYVVGGTTGSAPISDANVYDPSTGTWSAIAPLPEILEAPSVAFIGDTLYVAGGWTYDVNQQAYIATTDVWAYDPGTNSWSQKASLPSGVSNGGTAVVGGKLYVIGGLDSSESFVSSVYSYDPGNNSWTTEPAYGVTSASTAPVSVMFPACGGVNGLVVCAGGNGAGASTYTLTPGASYWVQKSGMPDDAWGAAVTTANGQLDVMGGMIENSTAVTNEGYSYDPADDTWSALPNSNHAFYRGGAACGIYQVGGLDGTNAPTATAQTLPGYDQCGGTPDWMSLSSTGFDVNPGQTVTVQVTADSSVVSQPGSYAGQLVAAANTPYPTLAPVGVTMQVSPPSSWGKVTGTVTDASGAPISGATLSICTNYAAGKGSCGPTRFTLTTDAKGDYQLWVSSTFSPLQVIASKDGYTAVANVEKIKGGKTVTDNFTLAAS